MKLAYHRITLSLACAVLSTAVSVAPAADYSTVVQSHSPLGYWQFTEAGPSPAPYKLANSGSLGSAGDAYANSSTSNGVAGKVNNAVHFINTVGTGHADTRADVVWNPALNTSMFSVEFWAQPGTGIFNGNFDGTGSCPISDFNPNFYPGGRVGWLFYLAPSGFWNFRLGLPSGYAANLISSTGVGAAGVWQHIAATYDGTNVNLYINGSLAVSTVSPAASTGWVPNTGSFLRFGATPLPGDTVATTADGNYYLPWDGNNTLAGNRGWDGLLDEVAVYSNVLSAATILAHYNAAATPGTYGATILAAGPVGYWNFDEPAYTAPSRSALPISANSGSTLSAADGTNEWGAVVSRPGPSYGGFPAADKAVSFNLVQSSISLKDAPGLHFSGNITLAAWVKPSANDFKHDIIEHGFDGLGVETFLRLSRGYGYGDGKYYEIGATEGAQNDGWYDSALYAMPSGDVSNWVFVAGTFDGANWNLYRNGLLVASVPRYVGPTGDQDTGAIDVATNWTIGSRSGPGLWDGNNFAGSIAEPAIFSSALSASDILSLYNAAHVPPVITRAVQVPVGTYKGSSAGFNVWAEGNTNLSYAWTSNSVAIGGNVTNITLNNLAAGPLTVACVVTNLYGSVTSSVSYTVVASKPLITLQPVAIKRFVGLPFQFSTAAGGTLPITYQWNTNGVPIPGATSSTFSGIVSAATAGIYSCTLNNEAGSSNTLSVALTAVPVPSGYPSVVYANGPMAYYRLDETNGTLANDYVSGINGLYNNTTLGVPGYSVLDSDTAASFSGVNSYVGSISGTGINFTGHTNFSLEAWVKGSVNQNDEATIIGKGIGAVGTTRSEQFSLDVSAGAYRFFTTRGNTLYEADAISGPNGSWQHIVGVYDDQNVLGNGGTNMYIFVNGVLEGQGKANPFGLNNTASAVSIGSKRSGNDPNYDSVFEGTIDEVAVYNYPLSASTIQTHFASAYPNTAPFISVQPSPLTNYAGLSVTLTIVAAGTQPLNYTWTRNNVALFDGPTANGSTISGSTSDRMTISGLSLLDAGTYSVGLTNSVNPGTKSIGVPLVVLLPPTNPPAIPGLVVHLPFNNNLNDVSGRGNNAVSIHTTTNLLGGGYSSNVVAATFTDGHLGTNFAFHYVTQAANTGGTTSQGTDAYYATLGVVPDLQFGSNVNFSVAYWIRLTQGFQGGDLPFFTDSKGSEGNNGFVFAPAYAFGTADSNPTTDPSSWAGCWAFTVYGGGNGIRIYGSNNGNQPGVINDGSYHHLVHVFDRAAGTSVTYLDGEPNRGVKNAGTTLIAAGNIDTGLNATIGQDPTGLYGEAGSGDIAELGVWRKALTPLEAASIYIGALSNHVSFTTAPLAPLTETKSGSLLILTWTSGFMLTTATNLNGPWTDVTTASPLTINPTAAKQFFRVRF